MSDNAPPSPLPPAAQAPWPAHPAPHKAAGDDFPKAKIAPPPAIGALGLTLIGGAVAAAVGALAYSFFTRSAKPAPAKPVRKAAARRKTTSPKTTSAKGTGRKRKTAD